jgi:hypothetical protein
MEKPRYSASKRMIYGSLVAAWGLIYMLAYAAGFRESEKAIAFASIVVPLAFALIVALLGVHRGFGSLDMRTQLKHGPLARDQPGPATPEAATDGGQT